MYGDPSTLVRPAMAGLFACARSNDDSKGERYRRGPQWVGRVCSEATARLGHPYRNASDPAGNMVATSLGCRELWLRTPRLPSATNLKRSTLGRRKDLASVASEGQLCCYTIT